MKTYMIKKLKWKLRIRCTNSPTWLYDAEYFWLYKKEDGTISLNSDIMVGEESGFKTITEAKRRAQELHEAELMNHLKEVK